MYCTMKNLFIAIIGPSGSGKTTIKNTCINLLLQKYEKNIKSKNVVSLSIDDVIENDEEYIKRSNDYVKNNVLITKEQIYMASNFLTNLYFERRNALKVDFSKYLEETIINANDNVVFETTGINSMDWIFQDKFLIRKNYIICIIYSYTKTRLLESRIINRFINSLKCKQITKIPRLPLTFSQQGFFSNNDNLSLSLVESVPIIQKNIKDYMCRFMQFDNIIKADSFIIFDNNSTPFIIDLSEISIEQYYIFLKKMK